MLHITEEEEDILRVGMHKFIYKKGVVTLEELMGYCSKTIYKKWTLGGITSFARELADQLIAEDKNIKLTETDTDTYYHIGDLI
jgi:hypothetical protein